MIHGKYIEVYPVVKENLEKHGIHVTYFCSGRGLGKTYSSLDLMHSLGTGEIMMGDEKDYNKFLYIRRSEKEAKSVANPAMNPFKKYNKLEGTSIEGDFSEALGVGNFYEKNEHIGYCAALSTFSNLRGVDFSDVVFIVYDECIPESKRKRNALADEGILFLQMLETINRNRALEGLPEVVVVLLSNPIDLGSILLSQLGFTAILDNMIFRNQHVYRDKNRSLCIMRYEDHPVSKEKEEKSFLYKFAKGTAIESQNLEGKFSSNDLSLIVKKIPLIEYEPLFILENLCVYRHKSNNLWHISRKMQKCRYNFKAYQQEALRETFYWAYKNHVVTETVTYDNYQTRTSFNAMIGYKAPY